jgi:transglutaminase-like putative cysteine protease
MALHNPNRYRAVVTSDAEASAPTVIRSPVPVYRSNTRPAPGARIRIALDESQPDAYSIVSILQGLSEQFAADPSVREFTVNEVLCSSRNNDISFHVQKITDFVMEQLIYTRDPVGAEYVISPVNLIKQIVAAANGQGSQPTGDCDDHVLLLNAMLGSVGVPCKVVAVKLNGSALFNHVISSALVDGKWMDIDPCAKEVQQPNYSEKLVAV